MKPWPVLALLLSVLTALAIGSLIAESPVEAHAANRPPESLGKPAWGTILEFDVLEFDGSCSEWFDDGDWPPKGGRFLLTDLEAYFFRTAALDASRQNVLKRGIFLRAGGVPIECSCLPTRRSPAVLGSGVRDFDRPIHFEVVATPTPCNRIHIRCRIDEMSGPKTRGSAAIPDGGSVVFLGNRTEQNTYVGLMVSARLAPTELEQP